jgi:hypothetical protein
MPRAINPNGGLMTNENQEKSEETAGMSWKMSDVITYVKELMVYEEQIKILQDSKREWSKEFLEENHIPKKELAVALSIVRKDLDADAIDAMYEEIKMLAGGDEE